MTLQLSIKLLAVGALLGIPQTVMSASRSLFVYLDNGVEPLLISELQDIRLSNVDIDGTEYSAPVVQCFCTADSIYSYRISEIKKVSFVPLPTVARSNAIDLAEQLAPYIEGLVSKADGVRLTLSADTPESLMPQWYDYLYQFEPSEKLPYGLAARVNWCNGKDIYLSPCSPEDIFESLELTHEVDLKGARTEESGPMLVSGISAPGIVPWYVADCHMPHNTVNIMTDSLKDIPVGPSQAYVQCKVRVQPIRLSCQTGIYVIPSYMDGSEPTLVRRMHSAVSLNLTASASGRCMLRDETKGDVGEPLEIQSVAMGLGQKFTAKFSGSVKASGNMGIEYAYSAGYNASAVTSIFEINGDEAAAATSPHLRVISVPKHTLDASFSGSLNLSGSLTLTVTGVADSLKSISHTYTFGSSLSGDALYRTSQLPDAHTSHALYSRITSTGVKASPVESLSTSINYASVILKNTSKVTPTSAVTYYAVPKFESPAYKSGVLTYPIGGEPMKDTDSALGVAVMNAHKEFAFTSTTLHWPTGKSLTTKPVFSVENGDIMYPTATLCEKVILCAPSYPNDSSVLSPVISYSCASGVRLSSGYPFFEKGTNDSSVIYLGTPPGYIHTDKK